MARSPTTGEPQQSPAAQGAFRWAPLRRLTAGRPVRVSLADVDGDGFADAVLTTGRGRVRILLNWHEASREPLRSGANGAGVWAGFAPPYPHCQPRTQVLTY